MKAKITTRMVKSLEPKDKAFEVVDTEVKGFLLRVQPTGRMTFYYSYRNEAKVRKRIKIGALGSNLTLAQAKDKALQIAGDVAEGKDVQTDKKASRQIAAAIHSQTLYRFIEELYHPWACSNLKSGAATKRLIEYAFSHLNKTPLAQISTNQIAKWQTQKLDAGLKPSTINRYVNALRAVLTKATEWEVIAEHPLKKLKPLTVDQAPKVRYLSGDEEQRLSSGLIARDEEIKAARGRANEHRTKRGYELLPSLAEHKFGDRLSPMIILSLKTGMRRGEVFDICWEDLDFDQKTITINAAISKSNRTRHIPMNKRVVDTLSYWRDQVPSTSGRIFPADSGGRLDNTNKAWNNLLKAANIESFRWHDMRHDFASKLVMKGVPLNTIRELCGHSDLNTTLRYAHLAPDHKAEAVSLLE